MYIEGFGEKKTEFYTIEGTSDLLKVQFYHDDKLYYGIVDKNGKLLVPISFNKIIEIFATQDNEDYCFIRENSSSNYESFHLGRDSSGNFNLKAHIVGNESNNLKIVDTEKDNYWLLSNTTNEITKVCLYDVKGAKILTPMFTEISFEEEESRVLAFVEEDIVVTVDEESIYLTSLLSYIDYEGNFVAPIYDTELDVYHDSLSYNIGKNFKSYNRFVESVTDKHKSKYLEKQDHINEVLADMFVNLYSIDEMKKDRKPAKILEYRRKI